MVLPPLFVLLPLARTPFPFLLFPAFMPLLFMPFGVLRTPVIPVAVVLAGVFALYPLLFMPFGVLRAPVIQVVVVLAGVFALHAALFTDHAVLIPAHLFLLVTVVGPMRFLAPFEFALLAHLGVIALGNEEGRRMVQ